MTNTTRGFLGDSSLWRDAQIEYDDVHGFWGGRHIIVQGDGRVSVRTVDRTQSEQITRGDIGDAVFDVLGLCVDQDVLSIPANLATLVPDETTMEIVLTNSAGETRIVVAYGSRPVDPRFRAVADALLAIESRMGTGPTAEPRAAAPAPPVAASGDETDDKLLRVLTDFFVAQGWSFSRHAEKPILRFEFAGKNGNWRCVAQSIPARQQLLFYSVCPVPAPEAKRTAVAEFITRANYGMATGNFEMDFSDGEVRYKTSLECEDVSPIDDFNLIRPMVYRNLTMLDRYLPGIMQVIYADVSPADAVARIESA